MRRDGRGFRGGSRWGAAVVAVSLAGHLVGCGQAPKRDVTTIRVWHWMTDREDAFDTLAKRYQETHQIPVRFELYAPSDLYSQKVRAAAQTDGLPDIFGVLGELRDLTSFVKAGHILPLTSAMDENGAAWRKSFFPIALAMSAFREGNSYGAPPGVYGVPIDVMNLQLFYNKRLLTKLGFDADHPPKTWAEFLEVGKRAKAQGLIGMVSGWAELWLIDAFANSYAIHLMGQEKVAATFRGDLNYTDGAWIKVLDLFEQLRESGLLTEDIVTMGNKRAEQLFANEQAVFAFNGTWGVNVYQGMNANIDYGVMMLPPVRPERPMVTWGGAGASFMVNARSPRAQQAVAFLHWLTDEEQQRFLLETTHNLPANQTFIQHHASDGTISGPLVAFANGMEVVVHPRLFDVQEQSEVIEAFDKGIQSILIGEKTPKQVAQDVQQVKQRQAVHQTGHQAAMANVHVAR